MTKELSQLIKKTNFIMVNNLKSISIFLICLILIITVLLPVLSSNYIADSLIIHLPMNHTHYGFGEFSKECSQIQNSIFTDIKAGRVHLTISILYPALMFFYSNSLLQAHFFTLSLTILSCFLFLVLLKKLFNSKNILFSIIIFLPLLFQIRTYHDPFIVYFGSFQLFFIFFLLSLTFFINYLKKNKISDAIFTIIFFFLWANAHEANIMLWPLTLMVYWFEEKKVWSKKIWPVIVNGIICVFAYFSASILQILLQVPKSISIYNGTSINFSLFLLIKTWLVQIFASFPLNFFLGRTGQEALSYYPHLFFDNLPIFFLAIISFASFFYFFYNIFKKNKKLLQFKEFIWSISFGFLLLILPAFPIAVSAKYQVDLSLLGVRNGNGYLMVYYQYFGVAIILGTLFYQIFCVIKAKKIFLFLLTINFSIIFYLSYCANFAAVKQVNKAYEDYRFILTQAKEANFFNELEKGPINLYLTHRDSNYYNVNDGNRNLINGLKSIFNQKIIIDNTCSFADKTCLQLFTTSDNLFYLYYDQTDEYSGYVIFAKITGFYQDLPTSNQVKIYYTSAYLNDNWPGNIYPKLRKDMYTTYQVLNNENLELQANNQWITRDRKNNSTVITINNDLPIVLDTIVPNIIQHDRQILDSSATNSAALNEQI